MAELVHIDFDEIEADLAFINKWSRVDMGALTLHKLIDKHAKAVDRHNKSKGSQ